MSNKEEVPNQLQHGHYDYIIVGAGSSGCAIARRLIDHTDAKVLLLEAGGSQAGVEIISEATQWPAIETTSQFSYNYNYEPSLHLNNRIIPLPRGKVIGGSGSINAMVWARGNKLDYDGWAELGNKGWDFESVLPLFKKIEDWEDGETDFHGAGGPIRVERAKDLHVAAVALIEACQSIGIPFIDDANGPLPEGVANSVENTKNRLRSGPANGYLDPILHHKNLTLLTGAQVLKLNFEGTQCTGLDFVQNKKSQTVKASKEVILCAGAVDTPRILMLSGIGQAKDLHHLGIATLVNLPGVGQNSQDQLIIEGLCFEANEPLTPLNNNLLGSTLSWKTEPDLKASNMTVFATQIPFGITALASQFPIPANSFGIVPGILRNHNRGYIKMKTAKHDGPLEIQANFLEDERDLDNLVKSVEFSLDLVNTPIFKNIIKKTAIQGKLTNRRSIVDFIRVAATTYEHICGTCAMGHGPMAVVSDQLLVHGTQGLRIADASIMPRVTSSNTQAPTLMIAEFAAKLILKELFNS